MKEIYFTKFQTVIFKFIGLFFVISLIIGFIGRIFFPVTPNDVVTPGDPTVVIDYFLGTVYGFQYGLIIFGAIGCLFYLFFFVVTSYSDIITIKTVESDSEKYNEYWKQTWLGLALVLLGLSIAFIPLQVNASELLLFPTLVLGTIIGAIGALFSKNGLNLAKKESK